MAKHALLSASSAHRWTVCTPSARLEEKYPDTQSESASEGTFAHAWAELQLRKLIYQVSYEDFHQQVEKMQRDKFYSNALVEYVDEYVDFVFDAYLGALGLDDGTALLLEQKLDFSKWIPEGFGYGDAVIISDGVMQVIDLKYGRNVAVTAENNPQLRLYALGAYNELSCLYDIDTVEMDIVQPRNGGHTSETLSIKSLLEWGEKIRKVAETAYKGEGEQVAGEHCRFCKHAPRCRALKEKMDRVVDVVKSKDIPELSDEEVSLLLKEADGIISWLHHVQEYALTEARDNGYKFPGFKLVEGRSNRKYSDEPAIARVLIDEGYNAESIFKPQTLIGITDMQKLVGRKHFDNLLSDFIIKPPGKPTLVPESDKRPEWNSAADDFEEIPF